MWKIVFVIAQILWIWFVPIPFVFKSEKIIMSTGRRDFEMLIDLIYLVNIFVTPFMAINRKTIDKKLQKKAYPKIEMRQVKGSETRVRILLLNYLSYHFLIDLLSSITGVITFQKVVRYHNWQDVLYTFKFLRFFSVLRLSEQVKFLTGRLRDKFGRLFPKLTATAPLIEVLFLFYLFVHFLATVLVWRAVNAISAGNSWYFTDQASIQEYRIQANSQRWFEATSSLYVNSFYFGCTTLTTVGYGDFKPFSMYDRLLFYFVLVFGVLAYTRIFDEIRYMAQNVAMSPMDQIMEENE